MINIFCFNVCWFGLVYFGNRFIPIALLYLAVHLFYFSKIKREYLLIFVISLLGTAVDFALQACGFFIFSTDAFLPAWLIVLWSCFATTICHSLKFLQCSKILQVIIGALVAPLSYFAGAQLRAVELGFSLTYSYLILGLIWSTLMLIFFYFSARLINMENGNV